MSLFHLVHVLLVRTETARVTSRSMKHARCEVCDTAYVYAMQRTVQGRASGPRWQDKAMLLEEARSRGLAQAAVALGKSCDPVPCPTCGWLQRGMLREHRRRSYQWLLVVGAIVSVGLFVTGESMSRQPISPTLLILAGCTLALTIALRAGLPLAFNPNGCPRATLERAGTGRLGIGIFLAEYERQLAQEAAAAAVERQANAAADEDAARRRHALLRGTFRPQHAEPPAVLRSVDARVDAAVEAPRFSTREVDAERPAPAAGRFGLRGLVATCSALLVVPLAAGSLLLCATGASRDAQRLIGWTSLGLLPALIATFAATVRPRVVRGRAGGRPSAITRLIAGLGLMILGGLLLGIAAGLAPTADLRGGTTPGPLTIALVTLPAIIGLALIVGVIVREADDRPRP